MRTEQTYTFALLRRPKGRYAVELSDLDNGGLKTRAHWLIEALGGKWGRRTGYHLSKAGASDFVLLYEGGWSASRKLTARDKTPYTFYIPGGPELSRRGAVKQQLYTNEEMLRIRNAKLAETAEQERAHSRRLHVLQHEHGGIPEEPELFWQEQDSLEACSVMLHNLGFTRDVEESIEQHCQAYFSADAGGDEQDVRDYERLLNSKFDQDDTVRLWTFGEQEISGKPWEP